MTITPMLPLWLLLPVGAVLVALAVWQVLRSRRSSHWAARLALVLLVLVLALRPAIPGHPATAAAQGGLEVYFLVDTTSSVAAEDYGPQHEPRLDGVKSDIDGIVHSLPGAQFALVTFDSFALERVPLTTDASAVQSAVASMTQEVTNYSSGTSIDAGLDLMKRVLTDAHKATPDRPRVLFYLGDGEQTRATQPRSFAALKPLLTGGGVLGYGTQAGGRMTSFNGYPAGEPGAAAAPTWILDYSTNPPTDAVSHIDETALRTIAAQLGVPYNHRTAGDPVAPLVAGITVPTPSAAVRPEGAPTEFYWLFAVPIAALLVRETFVATAALTEIRPQEPQSPRRPRSTRKRKTPRQPRRPSGGRKG
jgi:Ca-activated chloride channel family protein